MRGRQPAEGWLHGRRIAVPCQVLGEHVSIHAAADPLVPEAMRCGRHALMHARNPPLPASTRVYVCSRGLPRFGAWSEDYKPGAEVLLPRDSLFCPHRVGPVGAAPSMQRVGTVLVVLVVVAEQARGGTT